MIIPVIGAGFLTLLGNAIVAAPTVADFAELPMFSNLEISPGGKFLAARVNHHNIYTVAIFDIAAPKIVPVYKFAENEERTVRWFRWVTPEHLLVSLLFTSERGRHIKTHETRLIVVNTTSSEMTAVFRERRQSRLSRTSLGEMPVQFQDDVVSFLPHDPKHILLQYSRSDPGMPDVYKVPITKRARHKVIQRGKAGVGSWLADRDGEIRLGEGIKGLETPFLTMRLAGEKKWLDFSRRVNQEGIVFRPLAFASEPNELYVASNHEGDPTGLYLFDIEADEFSEAIFQHPTVDIASIYVDHETGKLDHINFVEDSVKTKYFYRKPIEDDIATMLRSQFEGLDAKTAFITKDGDHAVIRIQAADYPGSYYLFDRKTPKLRQLPPPYPGLSDEALGTTFATSYEARDGLSIPAFVTLPPGMKNGDSASMIPFVILPHGGPGARDFLRFDYWVQFLATRGYGVLQMNFRGSTGYGQSFKHAGHREWGQAMQGDITDGVTWLIENKYADPDRIAIMGGSYGGYAALMGAVKTPDLYKCSVSFAGVTDLPDLLVRERKFIGGVYATRFIGNLWKDRKMLAENSPARRAQDITVPVLLFHGAEDITVDIDQSVKMAKALKKHGKDYEFIRLKNGDHHLSLYVNRLKFLTETGKFLADCLN